MIVALLLLGAVVTVLGVDRYGKHPAKNSPYHPLEHNSRYQSSSSSSRGDNIHHNPAKYGKDYKFYNSWSKSEIEPKRNEPLFVARTLQTQTKKYIKNRLHAGNYRKQVDWKAYCEGNTQARCELFVCAATRGLVAHHQFAKHLSHTNNCPNAGHYPSLAITPAEKKKTHKNEQFRAINPLGLLRWMKAQYTKAKKLCHKTTHTTDDRCKAEVLCLTLEIFPEVWPRLFVLDRCTEKYFMTRDPRSPKLKHLDHSDYKDFPRLKAHWNKDIPLLPIDEHSLSTRFQHHLRNKKEQNGHIRSSDEPSSWSSPSSSSSSSSSN